ncbi:hypothetical protein C7271_07905 [filamentous cyanobacterium CCP5]|nr:hypothetical protein C7271_07905 [filamentous cyanobacterium CCP5]
MVHQHSIDYSDSSSESSASLRSPTKARRFWRAASGLLLFLAIAGSAALVLEYYGKINIVPGFGQGGRPAWRLGLWQLQDVGNDTPAAAAIHGLVDADIISGYADDQFRPEQPITRAEFAALVNAAFIDQSAAATSPFTDVPKDFWGHKAIAQTAQAGFFTGYRDSTFRPEQPLTHAEALIALVQGLDIERDLTTQGLDRYADADQISASARPAITAAVGAGLLDNQPETERLNPHQPMTRAEAAALIDQTRQYLQ